MYTVLYGKPRYINSVDLDQLASQKPADSLHSACKIHTNIKLDENCGGV